MKVLQYLHTPRGGHWKYTTELARALARQADTMIVTSGRVDDHAPEVRCVTALSSVDLTVRGVRRLSNRLEAYRKHPLELAAVLKAERTASGNDVVHFQQLPTFQGRKAVQTARSLGYRTVVTVHNVTPHSSKLKDRLQHREATKAWAIADVLIVHSDRLRGSLLSLVPGANVRVVPHPLWPANLEPAPDDQRDFLFFGVLRENKGIDLFIEALALLGDPPASIVGSGSQEMIRGLRNQLDSLGVARCNFVPGYCPEAEVPSVLAGHQVLVAPYTHFDAQSGVTHLALAYRRPMVVTDMGGLGDLVREFGVGVVVTPDAQSVAQGMLAVRSQTRLRAYESGFSQAAAVLGIDSIAQRTIDCYESPRDGDSYSRE